MLHHGLVLWQMPVPMLLPEGGMCVLQACGDCHKGLPGEKDMRSIHTDVRSQDTVHAQAVKPGTSQLQHKHCAHAPEKGSGRYYTPGMMGPDTKRQDGTSHLLRIGYSFYK